MAPKKKQSKGKKIISIETKKDIIKKHEEGMRVIELAAEYKMAKSTIGTILKKKDVLKDIDVAKGVTVLAKNRPPLVEEVEKLLLVWINERQLAGESISEVIICEKAKMLYRDLMERNPAGSAAQEEFKASKGWLQNFKKRSGIHSVARHGEAARSDQDASEAFRRPRMRQTKLDRFFTRMEPAAKRQRQGAPGEDNPKEGTSTSQ